MASQAWTAAFLCALTACASSDDAQLIAGDDGAPDTTVEGANDTGAAFPDSTALDATLDAGRGDGFTGSQDARDSPVENVADAPSDVPSDMLVPADGGLCPDGGGCQGCLTCCNGLCVDLTNDPHNCQSCGVGCEAGQMCWQSGCIDNPPCVPPCEFNEMCCLDLHHEAGTFTVDCVKGTSCPLCTQLP
jgi:hypothetical protein